MYVQKPFLEICWCLKVTKNLYSVSRKTLKIIFVVFVIHILLLLRERHKMVQNAPLHSGQKRPLAAHPESFVDLYKMLLTLPFLDRF